MSMCLCVCMCVCVRMCLSGVWVCSCTNACVYIWLFSCLYVCLYMHVCVCVCVCVTCVTCVIGEHGQTNLLWPCSVECPRQSEAAYNAVCRSVNVLFHELLLTSFIVAVMMIIVIV